MHRRHFLTASAALLAMPHVAQAYAPLAYAPATWRDVRESTDKLVLNFRASWSLTCQMKQDLLTTLLQEDPAYRALTFVEVDWDTFGPAQWTQRLKVQRNSTLLGMKDNKEVARIVNEPFERALRRLLDATLAA